MNGKFPEPAGNAKGSVLHSAGLLCSLLGMWDWIVIKDALRAVVEIFILWVFLYQIYRAFHATRGARIMVGLFACFLALVVLAFFFQLNVISWILTRIFAPGLALALVVISSRSCAWGWQSWEATRFFLPSPSFSGWIFWIISARR